MEKGEDGAPPVLYGVDIEVSEYCLWSGYLDVCVKMVMFSECVNIELFIELLFRCVIYKGV